MQPIVSNQKKTTPRDEKNRKKTTCSDWTHSNHSQAIRTTIVDQHKRAVTGETGRSSEAKEGKKKPTLW
jgi:hypothetical protein